MRTLPLQSLVIASLVLTAACAGKKKDLPPVPPQAVEAPKAAAPEIDPNAGMNTGVVTRAVVPGSAADFAATSGSDRVFFAYDSFEIDDAGKAVLDKQSGWLRRYGNVKVTLEGHADERGTREYNLALGDRRANAAKNYLAAQGVDVSRITTISYGKERPAAAGSDDESYGQNRRAVTVITSGAVG